MTRCCDISAVALLAVLGALSAPLPCAVRAQAPTPRPGAAQPALPLASSLSGQAKSDYDTARILFADRDYAGAFVKFQQAYLLAGDVRLLWNMAVCEKNLRHYASVLGLLERYKREGSANMTDTHRQEVDDVLSTVKTLISTVQVLVNEPGASIFVDDRLMGTSPLAGPLLIDLGKRRLRIAKQGFVEQSMLQEFGGGSSVTLRFNLVRKPTEARVTIAAEGMIYIDGKRVGERYWAGTLQSGEHTLRVTAEGMRPYERDVMLQAGQSRTLNITLSPDKRGVPAFVWVGAGVLLASGLAVGGYFLFRDEPPEANIPAGTLTPYFVNLQ